MRKRSKLYLIAVLISAIFNIGTAGALELEKITLFEACWQIGFGLAMGLWFWNLLRLEETRAARVVHRSRWTW